ncbi:chitinase-3-like protein 1 [Hyposmocoma kahamanoa]|uniref:chitinase-3-like protein 1 n=1 Tax=Hyposmocoma kahamanoa TaxID=1477025 RepID=UPI000E6DA24C|nr:chitinase-3-like protein 1 [Hyposmocoma kahamanoa]
MGLSVFALVLFAISAVSGEKHVVCYYGSWATYRLGLGQFNVEHINTDLCTHLVYTFVGINNQGTVVSLDSWLDLPENWGRDNFGKFNALKKINPNLKTILAVGGWNEGSAKYSIMAANPALRKNFVTSALQMVLKHGFDGFDVDWEYPNRRDTVNGEADIDNFTMLLKELREAFNPHGLLITAALSADKTSASLSYDIPAISKYLDLIHLMTYDMYGSWNTETGHNAALHKGESFENVPKNNVLTVDVAVEYWLSQGAPPEKLVLGVPAYGRTFDLVNANVNGVRAPSSGAGISGPYTQQRGHIGYNEFCHFLRTQSWEVRYDEEAKVPYAVQGHNWVSFDNPSSITKKVEYALSLNLGGIMLWSIETDDFHGQCGEDFPMLRTINRVLRNKNVSESTSTPVPSNVTTEATTSASSSTESAAPTTTTEPPVTEIPEDSICKSEGFTSSPVDCSIFYLCVTGVNGELIPTLFKCPDGLHWDNTHKYCNFPDLVDC